MKDNSIFIFILHKINSYFNNLNIFAVTPSLTISPARVEARAGGSVQLRCQPQGSGPFNIEWMKVDGILNPSATQSVDGLLEIRQITAADAGRYRCLATSSTGSSDGFAIVSVQGDLSNFKIKNWKCCLKTIFQYTLIGLYYSQANVKF